jgi:hypothetical protein
MWTRNDERVSLNTNRSGEINVMFQLICNSSSDSSHQNLVFNQQLSDLGWYDIGQRVNLVCKLFEKDKIYSN